MSDQEPENNNLIKFIAAKVESMGGQMNEMRSQMATKNDLEQMATKSDLEQMATKSDLEQMATKSDLEQMATKSDVESLRGDVESLRGDVESLRGDVESVKSEVGSLKGDVESVRDQVGYLGGQVETVRDQMATKSDLAQLEERLTTKLEVEVTTVRGDIEQVHLRLDSVDKLLRVRLDNIEVEVSRLRSVLYLLVKDRPDMLRLLGETPPPPSDEGRPGGGD